MNTENNKTMAKKKKKTKVEILVDASGKAVRELAIENGEGFKRVTKVHKNKKKYNRKEKHKKTFE